MASFWFDKVRFLSNIILNNWQIKLVSLCVAVLVWLYVVSEGVYYQQVAMPIAVEDIPEGMILSNVLPAHAVVSVHGQGRDLLHLRQSSGRVVVKLGSRLKERRSYSLSKMNVEAPAGIDVQEVISPKAIDIELDSPLERDLRVVSRVVIRPSQGFSPSGRLSVHPSTVKVYGPRDVVRRMEFIATDSVVWTGVRDRASKTIKLNVPPDANIRVTPTEVTVRADLHETSDRWIRDVRLRIANAPAGKKVRVDPEEVDIKITGRPDRVDAADPRDFAASVDFRRRRPGAARRLDVKVVAPPGIRWVETKPTSVAIID